MIKGMDLELARRYVKVMDQIEKIVDNIHAIAYIMSLLCELDEGQAHIRPYPIGYLGKMIANDVLWITSILENDFVSSTEIKLKLKENENSDRK